MTRRQRVALELFGPAPLGVGVLVVSALVGEGHFSWPGHLAEAVIVLGVAAIWLVYAYLFTILPCALCTWALETAFRRGLRPTSWRAVGLASALGATSGILIGWVLNEFHWDGTTPALFGANGWGVGTVIGFVTRHRSKALPTAPTRVPRLPWLPLTGLVMCPLLAWFVTRNDEGWIVMWTIAVAEWFALKLLTLNGLWRVAPLARVLGYLFLWPGLNARAFLGPRDPRPTAVTAPARELVFALAKFAAGLAAILWAAHHATTFPADNALADTAIATAPTTPPLLVAWVGMLGIIFTLHFGALHVVSWMWRRAGIVAPPLMRAPILATSLTEFWSERWNLAFADAARRFVFRPLARRWGAAGASATVFLASGLVHESVISVPARGGWGGPTLYFVLQGAGAWFERTARGRALGLGRGARGWAWTFLITAAPVPLLFHAPFAERVIVPLFHTLKGVLP